MKKELFCLLIDDDADDHDIFQMSINRIDPSIRVDHASSGMEAISLLKSYPINALPDFIFLDLNMHIMNGMECLTTLKSLPDISEIRVIIYSTTINEQIIYSTLRLGAFDHIEKPNKAEDLDFYLKRVFQVEERKQVPPAEDVKTDI